MDNQQALDFMDKTGITETMKNLMASGTSFHDAFVAASDHFREVCEWALNNAPDASRMRQQLADETWRKLRNE